MARSRTHALQRSLSFLPRFQCRCHCGIYMARGVPPTSSELQYLDHDRQHHSNGLHQESGVTKSRQPGELTGSLLRWTEAHHIALIKLSYSGEFRREGRCIEQEVKASIHGLVIESSTSSGALEVLGGNRSLICSPPGRSIFFQIMCLRSQIRKCGQSTPCQ